MKPKLYRETTVPGYLTAWPSRDLVRAAHQRITKEWWERRRQDFELFISEPVLDEISAGDPEAARERLQVVQGLPILDVNEHFRELAYSLAAQMAAAQSRGRRSAHCDCGRSRHALFADMELPAYRQCRDLGDDQSGLFTTADGVVP